MIIIGHKDIPYKPLCICSSIKSISSTPPNSTLLISNTDDRFLIIKHCNENNISFCIEIENIQELMIFSNLNAKYLIIKDIDFSSQAQKIAENYMFDSKILFSSDDQNDISIVATKGIDGILFYKKTILDE